jgi:ABC-type lipoprotein export system ATPase subunit
MDDPLSALDTNVASYIMNETIVKHLKNKTRIVVTHAKHFLNKAHRVMIIEEGKIVYLGDYAGAFPNDPVKQVESNNDLNENKVVEMPKDEVRILNITPTINNNANENSKNLVEDKKLK